MTAATMDFDLARFNMVEQQIRPWDVLDQDVLDLMATVKREKFVPEAYRAIAFADVQVPLSAVASMWEPKLEARFVQELALKRNDRVLEIGTGSGYMAALLAARSADVVSLEIDRSLAEQARKNLLAAEVPNVTVEVADGLQGWAARAPFDVIVVTGSVAKVPDVLLKQLKVGGRMAVVVGEGQLMQAQIITQTVEGVFSPVTLFETSVAPLKGVKSAVGFEF